MRSALFIAILHAAAQAFEPSQSESSCCSRPEIFCLEEARAFSTKRAPERMDESTWTFLLSSSLSFINEGGLTRNTTSDDFAPLLKIGDQIYVTAEPWRRTLTFIDDAALQAMVFDTQHASILALSTEASPFKDCLLNNECRNKQIEELLIHLKRDSRVSKPLFIPGDTDNVLGRALASRIPSLTVEVPLVGNVTDPVACAYLCPIDEMESEYHYKAMPGAMERSLWMTAVAVLVMLGSWKGTFKFGH